MKFLRITLALVLIFCFVISYLPPAATAEPIVPRIIRVGLFFDNAAHQGASEINLTSGQGVEIGTLSGSAFNSWQVLAANDAVKIKVVDNKLQITAASGTVIPYSTATVATRPANGGSALRVAEKGLSYRGVVEISAVNGKLRVVNELKIEDYLYGVVPKEMSDSWPKEALKAQAVAARTYVSANLGTYATYGFDLTDDVYCQAYGGIEAEGNNSRVAVNETMGQILTYNGQAISALYHANSGGYTENSENVWSSALPYLKGVADPYSSGVGGGSDQWEVSYSRQELENSINSKLSNNSRTPIGSLSGVNVLETGVSGRLTKVRIDGSQGSTELKNDSIRYYLGNLQSTLFQIVTDNLVFFTGTSGSLAGKFVVSGNGEVAQLAEGTYQLAGGASERSVGSQPARYTFKGQGWGHGVGMSQWGAYGMAKAGKGYREILATYYQGTTLTQ